MTDEVKSLTLDDLESLSSGPAVLVNRFFVTLGPSGARIAFAEQFGIEAKANFRAAVVMPFTDALELANLLKTLLKSVEEQMAAAAKGRPMAREPRGGKGGTTKSASNTPSAAQAAVPKLVSAPSGGASGGVSFDGGSHLMPIATTRREMTYVLLESYVDEISELNTTTLTCFTLAGVAFSVFVGFAGNWIFAGSLNEAVALTVKTIMGASGASTLILGAFGIHFAYRKKSKTQQNSQ